MISFCFIPPSYFCIIVVYLYSMRKDKNGAIKLRKLGKSYNEIRAELRVPKSTLSAWFQNEGWSNKIAIDLAKKLESQNKIRLRELNRIRGEHLRRAYEEAEDEAVEEFALLKYHPLFIAGLMIYWGEGNKTSKYHCGIANTDPLMIKIFLQFLRNICNFDRPRIKAWLLIYPDLDPKACLEYWAKEIGLNDGDFNKTMVITGKSANKRLPFGVCNVVVSSAYLKRKILIWIKMLANDLAREKYHNAGIV